MLASACATEGIVTLGTARALITMVLSGILADADGISGVAGRLAKLLKPLTTLFAGSVARLARAEVSVTATVVSLVSCINDCVEATPDTIEVVTLMGSKKRLGKRALAPAGDVTVGVAMLGAEIDGWSVVSSRALTATESAGRLIDAAPSTDAELPAIVSDGIDTLKIGCTDR